MIRIHGSTLTIRLAVSKQGNFEWDIIDCLQVRADFIDATRKASLYRRHAPAKEHVKPQAHKFTTSRTSCWQEGPLCHGVTLQQYSRNYMYISYQKWRKKSAGQHHTDQYKKNIILTSTRTTSYWPVQEQHHTDQYKNNIILISTRPTSYWPVQEQHHTDQYKNNIILISTRTSYWPVQEQHHTVQYKNNIILTSARAVKLVIPNSSPEVFFKESEDNR